MVKQGWLAGDTTVNGPEAAELRAEAAGTLLPPTGAGRGDAGS